MAFDRTIRGDIVQADQPSWLSLHAVLGTELAGSFMWMYELRLDDGDRVDAYKHVITRRYLHLAGRRAFAYHVEGYYEPTGLDAALTAAFDGWERSKPPVQHRLQLAAALESARERAA